MSACAFLYKYFYISNGNISSNINAISWFFFHLVGKTNDKSNFNNETYETPQFNSDLLHLQMQTNSWIFELEFD